MKKTASRGSQSDGASPVGCTRARPSDSSTSSPSKKGVAASVVVAKKIVCVMTVLNVGGTLAILELSSEIATGPTRG